VNDHPFTVALHSYPAGTTVLQVAGDLDHHTAPHLQEALGRTPFTPTGQVVVDLAELTYCDSTGITVLVTAYQRAQAVGGSFSLAAVNPDLMRVFQVTGLAEVFTIHPTVEQAIDPH